QEEIQNLSSSDEIQISQDIDNSSLMFTFFSQLSNTSNVESRSNSNELERYCQIENLLIHEKNDPLIW
ncbi:3509_t:CDS:1, partial [Diversispora eburnea]